MLILIPLLESSIKMHGNKQRLLLAFLVPAASLILSVEVSGAQSPAEAAAANNMAKELSRASKVYDNESLELLKKQDARDESYQAELQKSCVKSKKDESYCSCMATGIAKNKGISDATKKRLSRKFTSDVNEAMGVTATAEQRVANREIMQREFEPLLSVYVPCLNKMLQSEHRQKTNSLGAGFR